MDEPSQQRQAELQACVDVALLYVQAAIACLERVEEAYHQSAEVEERFEGQRPHEQPTEEDLSELAGG